MPSRINKTRNTRRPLAQGKRSGTNAYKRASTEKKSSRILSSGQKILLRIAALKSIWVLLLCVCLGTSMVLGISVGTIWLYRMATTWDFFTTNHVEVVGNVRLSHQMVQDLAKVHKGTNSLTINISKVEQKLMQTPWVEEVSVKRILPDRFVITIEERMPSFWVRRDGTLYYADIEGTLIAPVETKNFMALPTLEVEPGSEDELANLANYLNDLKAGKLPVEFGAVSALRMSAGKGLELYLDDREMLFSIALDDWQGNLQRLSITLGDLARRKELSRVREIRATDGNVWVSKNK